MEEGLTKLHDVGGVEGSARWEKGGQNCTMGGGVEESDGEHQLNNCDCIRIAA